MSAFEQLNPMFLLSMAALLGLIFGSFVTALSYRLPRGLSIARGRSSCPSCNTTLGPRDLVPVLSWVLSRGACRHCGARVSARYPIIEGMTAGLFVAAAAVVSDPGLLGVILAATPIMVVLAVIDIEHRRLPNVLLVGLALLAALYRFQTAPDLVATMIAVTVISAGGLLIDRLASVVSGVGLGMGDTKLMAIMAIALPPTPLAAAIVTSGVLGLVWWLAFSRQAGKPLAFGPPILAVLWGGLIGSSVLAI